MATILVADDEARIRRLVGDFLRKDGHQIVEAEDGRQALQRLEEQEIDLVILDIMMPGYDGWSVLRQIRSRPEHLPVMMLTARNEEADEVFGFDLGADDYVGKPFSPLVLAARVRSLLGRSRDVKEQEITTLGPLSIDENSREVHLREQTVNLTPKEYELLIYFKNNRGMALSRSAILNSVWGYDYFGDLRTVDTHVKKLRAKLEDCGSYIQTVRGYGYRFDWEGKE
ncbi:MAG: response regulator transcription factor [Eubacteriales bacterium]